MIVRRMRSFNPRGRWLPADRPIMPGLSVRCWFVWEWIRG